CEADIAGENGLELCSWIRIVSPTTTPVILTWINDGSLAAAALKAGAAAFLLKNSPPDDLIFYLGSALAGQPIIDERVTMTLQRSADLDLQARFGLSSRERDVMEEVLQGLDNRSIACRLNISTDTVKSHVKAILRKTGARDRAHAIAVALGRCPSEIPTPRRPF
ncbi:MAG: response regulator transcription factor, partial [Thermoactinospora sp.]|nr:response regulator transcription factor [Thermoactinospora sp.]